MTASTVKSTKVTALQVTVPPALQNRKDQGGEVTHSVDVVEAATTSLDEADDIILMLPVHSSKVMSSLKIFNDDLDSDATPALVAHVGLYNGDVPFVDADGTKYAGFAVIDADFFATSITTLQAANTAGVELRYEAADIANAGKALWEAVGLGADPNKYFLVGVKVTVAAATAAAGTLVLDATLVG